MPLNPLLDNDQIREAVETRIHDLRQEQYGREEIYADDLRKLHDISVILARPEKFDPSCTGNKYSEKDIADMLAEHHIIISAYRDRIIGPPAAPAIIRRLTA